MNFRTLGLLGLAAGLALSSVSAFAQEPAATTPAATEAAASDRSHSGRPAQALQQVAHQSARGREQHGTLLFRVTPDKGTATDIVVNDQKGRSENGVATRHQEHVQEGRSTRRSTTSRRTTARTCW